jgi:predicted N-acetyltransferase YhbS
MRIELLADHRDALPTLAQWYYNEWSHFRPGWTVQDFADSIAERAHADRVPLTFVALEGQELIGTVCLDAHDMDTRRNLSPWLAGLYVKEEWRRQGIATSLVRAAESKAMELGIPTLYLYTPESEPFYSRRGWSLIERTVYHDCEVAIMEKKLVAEGQG